MEFLGYSLIYCWNRYYLAFKFPGSGLTGHEASSSYPWFGAPKNIIRTRTVECIGARSQCSAC
jgi:hypothetical protein